LGTMLTSYGVLIMNVMDCHSVCSITLVYQSLQYVMISRMYLFAQWIYNITIITAIFLISTTIYHHLSTNRQDNQEAFDCACWSATTSSGSDLSHAASADRWSLPRVSPLQLRLHQHCPLCAAMGCANTGNDRTETQVLLRLEVS